MATCAANEPQPECVGAPQEATELLKLLEMADLEEWHSKFLCYGYETVEDVELMNEEDMKEIGLESWQRFRLKLNLPKKASSKCTKQTRVTVRGGTLVIPSDEVPKQTPVVPSAALGPPKCDTLEVPKQTPVIPSAAPGPPKCDNTQEVPKQAPVIPSAGLQPEKCSEKGCRRLAVSKCRECHALLCLTHQQTIRKEETSGNTTIVMEVPGCSKCKEEHDQNKECEGLLKCLGGCVIPLLIGLIVLGVQSAN
eukprot:symbB.v1.2.032461.t1/scaffold3901.1/size48581/2